MSVKHFLKYFLLDTHQQYWYIEDVNKNKGLIQEDVSRLDKSPYMVGKRLDRQ